MEEYEVRDVTEQAKRIATEFAAVEGGAGRKEGRPPREWSAPPPRRLAGLAAAAGGGERGGWAHARAPARGRGRAGACREEGGWCAVPAHTTDARGECAPDTCDAWNDCCPAHDPLLPTFTLQPHG